MKIRSVRPRSRGRRKESRKQRGQADPKAALGHAASRLAACERALRRERREGAERDAALEVALEELALLRAEACEHSRSRAAARVRSARCRLASSGSRGAHGGTMRHGCADLECGQ